MTLTMACPDDDSVNFASANAYEARFDGSDLRGANFSNALLSNASFGKGEDGRWANVEGAEFEGALLSSSDARKLCQNPTLDIEGQIAVGGCCSRSRRRRRVALWMTARRIKFIFSL